jgi:glutaconyl-CoA/methylmalonyl-CoA decarboxylase subunit delta
MANGKNDPPRSTAIFHSRTEAKMGIPEIMTQLANPQTIKSLSFMEKMIGGSIVTCLGMGITFMALILLQFLMDLQSKIIARVEKKDLKTPAPFTAINQKAATTSGSNSNDEELIAVISAAVAMEMQKPTGDIRIRTIRKIEEPSLAWNRAGIFDQMNMRL